MFICGSRVSWQKPPATDHDASLEAIWETVWEPKTLPPSTWFGELPLAHFERKTQSTVASASRRLFTPIRAKLIFQKHYLEKKEERWNNMRRKMSQCENQSLLSVSLAIWDTKGRAHVDLPPSAQPLGEQLSFFRKKNKSLQNTSERSNSIIGLQSAKPIT